MVQYVVNERVVMIQQVRPMLGPGDVMIVTHSGLALGGDEFPTFYAWYPGVTFLIDGAVSNAGTALATGVSGQAQMGNCQFQIGAEGLVSGATGIALLGEGNNLLNRGMIFGSDLGIEISAGEGPATYLVNHGIISATNAAINLLAGHIGTVQLQNFGTLGSRPDGVAYLAEDTVLSVDVLTNAGTIFGAVQLGGGDDRFSNSGQVLGTVYGGAGSDAFTPGEEAEVFDGGDGIDSLHFDRTAGVIVDLSGRWDSSGLAEADSYTGFENIYGSLNGRDSLSGNGLANALFGQGGSDQLWGRAGADQLFGGKGVDVLRGGAGIDQFCFQSAREGADQILDWQAEDQISLSASGFGGGLAAGNLAARQLRTRADNHAQDANDRFIFRTTDRTLWFDLDGKGGAKPVMIADLQAWTTIKATDFLLT